MAQKFTLQKLHFSIYWKVCNDFLPSFADPGTLPPAAEDNSIQNTIWFKLYSFSLMLHQIRHPGIRTRGVNVTRRKHSASFLGCCTFIHSTDTGCFCSTAAWLVRWGRKRIFTENTPSFFPHPYIWWQHMEVQLLESSSRNVKAQQVPHNFWYGT